MSKKKKSKTTSRNGFSNSKISKLVLDVFRKNLGKRFNYKQVSKILKIKESGVRIQLISVMKDLAESGMLEEVRRGSFRLLKKNVKILF